MEYVILFGIIKIIHIRSHYFTGPFLTEGKSQNPRYNIHNFLLSDIHNPHHP